MKLHIYDLDSRLSPITREAAGVCSADAYVWVPATVFTHSVTQEQLLNTPELQLPFLLIVADTKSVLSAKNSYVYIIRCSQKPIPRFYFYSRSLRVDTEALILKCLTQITHLISDQHWHWGRLISESTSLWRLKAINSIRYIDRL